MRLRTESWQLGAAVLAVLLVPAVLLAQDRQPPAGTTVRGHVVRVVGPENYFLLRTAEGKELRLMVGDRSVIRVEDRVIRLADLRPETEVTVVYTPSGEQFLASTITGVAVTEEVPVVRKVTVRATVVKVTNDPRTLVLRTAGGKEVVLTPDADTKFVVADKPVRVTDLKEGMTVAVVYTLRPVLTEVVQVVDAQDTPPPAGPLKLAGTVVAVKEGGILVLRNTAGKDVELRMDPAARILIDTREVAFANLKPGTPVGIVYEMRTGRQIVTSIEGPIVLTEVRVPVAGIGTITGVIVEGDRPQPNLEVVLRTDLGKVVANAKTNKDGTYMFEKVPAGLYVLSAEKPTSAAKLVGEARVTVEDGKTHVANIKLVTAP